MSSSSSAALTCGWNASIHLADPAFTSRVDIADSYVLPSLSTPSSVSTSSPTATLVSPWLLTSSPSLKTTTLDRCIETVPLAWRCPSCGNLEVEQLYWRRPPRGSLPIRNEASDTSASASVAALRATLARRLRLQGLSAKMKAKLERHRRRRERRDEMRWRSLVVGTRCRQCFLCPRCGGRSSEPGVGEATAGAPSASPLDIRLTKDLRYYAVCPCCQWHSYQAFPSMEQLLSYLDSGMGEDKAEAMREWRASQRSANTVLRSRVHETLQLLGIEDAEDGGELNPPPPPSPTVSQAAWMAYRQAISTAPRHPSPSSPRRESTPGQGHPAPEKTDNDDEVSKLIGLHPAVALEELRKREVARRVNAPVDAQAICVPPGAVQVMRVAELAQEAWSYFSRLELVKGIDPLDVTPAHSSCAPASRDGTSEPPELSEIQCIAHTQQSLMGLREEAVDTRQLTLHEWMQRYQPAAVIAQQRRASAAATAAAASPGNASPLRHARPTYNTSTSPSVRPLFLTVPFDKTPAKFANVGTPMKSLYSTPAAPPTQGPTLPTTTVEDAPLTPAPRNAHATPGVSALYHTPTSAYLQSLLQRQHDRALNLPAYCVPHSRKELLTGLVWRPAAASHEDDEVVTVKGSSVACTRVVVLNRPALSDGEVRRVYEHWSQLLEKEAERHSDGYQPSLQQQQQQEAQKGMVAGEDAESDSDNDEDNVEALLAADRNEASRRKGIAADVSPATTITALSPDASMHYHHQKKKKKRIALPPPLFLGGEDFAATGALPHWQYVGSTILKEPLQEKSSGEAGRLTWSFRLVNLGLLHDLYLTKLEVSGVLVENGQTGKADSAVTAVALSDVSTKPLPLTLTLSSPDVASAALPLVLQSRCSPEERAALALASSPSAVTESGDGGVSATSTAASDALSAQPAAPPQMPATPLRLSEVFVTLSMPVDKLDSALPTKGDARSVYVPVTMEVLTPLPDLSNLASSAASTRSPLGTHACTYTYHSVCCGVTVLLTPT